MTSPSNPDGFDKDRFSPPPRYREADIQEIVDNADGPEPQAVSAYPFSGRTFVELQPYDDEEDA